MRLISFLPYGRYRVTYVTVLVPWMDLREMVQVSITCAKQLSLVDGLIFSKAAAFVFISIKRIMRLSFIVFSVRNVRDKNYRIFFYLHRYIHMCILGVSERVGDLNRDIGE